MDFLFFAYSDGAGVLFLAKQEKNISAPSKKSKGIPKGDALVY